MGEYQRPDARRILLARGGKVTLEDTLIEHDEFTALIKGKVLFVDLTPELLRRARRRWKQGATVYGDDTTVHKTLEELTEELLDEEADCVNYLFCAWRKRGKRFGDEFGFTTNLGSRIHAPQQTRRAVSRLRKSAHAK